MKTTLEIPDSTFRRAKMLAAARGISLKQLFTEALDEKLRPTADGRKAVEPRWMKGFGDLADLKIDGDKATGNVTMKDGKKTPMHFVRRNGAWYLSSGK